ncbi:MAG: nuclear transport factor 2 family protein [Congregibacter sp.]
MNSAINSSNIDLAKLDTFMARQEILAVLARHSRGVDRADREILQSCYHADAIEEHGPNFNGPAMEYIEGAIERLKLMGPMAHYLCSSHVELDGDTAWVETYVLTFARFAAPVSLSSGAVGTEDDTNGQDATMDTLTGARSCDKFERRDGEWRIAHRKISFDWNRDMPSNEGWCAGMFNTADPNFHWARKDKDDLSYQRF